MPKIFENPGVCRVCGCTENNPCTNDEDENCHWVEFDLCSVCTKFDLTSAESVTQLRNELQDICMAEIDMVRLGAVQAFLDRMEAKP